MRKLFLMMIASSFLFGCATQSEKLARYGMVIPMEGGVFIANGSHRNSDTAMKIALASAEQACIKRQKEYVVVEYANDAQKGLVSEKTADAIDVAHAVSGSVPGVYAPIPGTMLRGRKATQVKFKCM